MMRYRIIHKTAYHYSEPASLSQNELFLYPRQTPTQQVIHNNLIVAPEPQYLQQHADYFGNIAHVFMVQHPHNELSLSSVSEVHTSSPPPLNPDNTPPWEHAVRQLSAHEDDATLDAYQFCFDSPMTVVNDDIAAFGRASFIPGRPILACALDLIQRIYKEFTYDKSATTVDTSVEQVLVKRKGVCQDFAHLAISCLRTQRLAARYISGYLETLPPPGKPKLVGMDASHAWLSIYVPGTGWVDLDPTNNMIPGERHITLAWGRDYGDVTPVKGVVMGGGVHTLSVMVDVSTVS